MLALLGFLVILFGSRMYSAVTGSSNQNGSITINVIQPQQQQRVAKPRKAPRSVLTASLSPVVVQKSTTHKVSKVKGLFQGYETDFLNRYHPSIDQATLHAVIAMKESSLDKTNRGDGGKSFGYFHIQQKALDELNNRYGTKYRLTDFEGDRAEELAVWAFSAYVNKWVPENKKSDLAACLNVWNKGPGAYNWGNTQYVNWVKKHYEELKPVIGIKRFFKKLSPANSIAVASSGGYINPVPGARRTRGSHGRYSAQDLAAPIGTPILATASGEVVAVSSGWHNGGFGNAVQIRDDKATVFYAHMNDIYVKVGDFVSQGQEIGTVGNTGRSTGPHLHIEYRGLRNPPQWK